MQDNKKIYGKKISENIGERLFLELQNKNLVGKVSLGILLVGNDKASETFINVKKKFGEKYGFNVQIERENKEKMEENEESKIKSKVEIKEKLEKLQKNNDTVIVQLPLPESLQEFTDEILSGISSEKDVDNLNMAIKEKEFVAPIVLALQKVLEAVDTTNLVFGIVGLGQVVGMPIKNYLQENNFKYIVIGRNDHAKIKDCDIVISGVGEANLIKAELIKENSILIDYGCSYVDGAMYGDFDKSCYDKCKFYTPVPGCMGPLVVASLFSNVLKSKKS